MDLLSIPHELQFIIYFKSLNFFNLIKLTNSIKLVMLICKYCRYLLLSQNASYFWYIIYNQLGWDYNNITNSKYLWYNFDPKTCITFKILNKNMIMLGTNGTFYTKSYDNITKKYISLDYKSLPSSIFYTKISNCQIKINDIINIKISPTGKFIATYENNQLILYKNELILYKHEIKLGTWYLFESYEGDPVVIHLNRDSHFQMELFYVNGSTKILPYKQFDTFNGGLLMWDRDKHFGYINLEVFNPDTNISNKITCVNILSSISPLVCRHTGIIVGIENNNILAFTNDNKILWKQSNNIVSINTIGYGLLLLMNDSVYWIADIYTGKKILEIDNSIFHDLFLSEFTAIENNIGYQIICKN